MNSTTIHYYKRLALYHQNGLRPIAYYRISFLTIGSNFTLTYGSAMSFLVIHVEIRRERPHANQGLISTSLYANRFRLVIGLRASFISGYSLFMIYRGESLLGEFTDFLLISDLLYCTFGGGCTLFCGYALGATYTVLSRRICSGRGGEKATYVSNHRDNHSSQQRVRTTRPTWSRGPPVTIR